MPKRKKKTIEQASLVQIIDTIDHHEERFMPKWFWKTVIKMVFFYRHAAKPAAFAQVAGYRLCE
ncbi:hypothetical protein Q9L42_010015 [Methylomarinum sp. Ch1-1]|uniref:Uncharacterized protein n=1 Tax=Methylomarinum roseum TaxID=3067653 RepID=A0AAU7NZH6_9GAMM